MTPLLVLPNYTVVDVIEEYDSLIWTERFDSNGEFKMTFKNVEKARTMVPLQSFIKLTDSNVYMFVESHEIKNNDEGLDELVISGRSFERVMLENRTLWDDTYPVDIDTGGPFTMNQILLKWMRAKVEAAYTPRLHDDYNGVTVVDATTFNSGPKDDVVQIEDGDLYVTVSKYLKSEKYGLKFNGTNRTLTLYNGTDRSTGANAVTFYQKAGHLLNPSYLTSNKTFKNIAYVNSPAGFFIVPAPGWSSGVSGVSRRILTINTSTDNLGTASDLDFYTQLAHEELAKYAFTKMLDAEISPAAPYKYGGHYNLGDTIKMSAEYGFDQAMIVSEYVRSEENGVERAYPGLIELDAG